MCHVKVGADVSTEADLQDLVTTIIMQQEVEFGNDEIFEKVRDGLSSSRFFEESNKIQKVISKTLDIFEFSGCISSHRGRYQAIKVV